MHVCSYRVMDAGMSKGRAALKLLTAVGSSSATCPAHVTFGSSDATGASFVGAAAKALLPYVEDPTLSCKFDEPLGMGDVADWGRAGPSSAAGMGLEDEVRIVLRD